jgi:hypothetical protein
MPGRRGRPASPVRADRAPLHLLEQAGSDGRLLLRGQRLPTGSCGEEGEQEKSGTTRRQQASQTRGSISSRARALIRPTAAHTVALRAGTTGRRHDATTFVRHRRITRRTQRSPRTQRRVEYQRLTPLAGTPALRADVGRSEGRMDHKQPSAGRLLVIHPAFTPATARSAAPPAARATRRDSQGLLCGAW